MIVLPRENAPPSEWTRLASGYYRYEPVVGLGQSLLDIDNDIMEGWHSVARMRSFFSNQRANTGIDEHDDKLAVKRGAPH
jgi:hypothetical protein